MKKHLDVDDEIDARPAAGSSTCRKAPRAFEVEYNKTIEQIRRARGLI